MEEGEEYSWEPNLAGKVMLNEYNLGLTAQEKKKKAMVPFLCFLRLIQMTTVA